MADHSKRIEANAAAPAVHATRSVEFATDTTTLAAGSVCGRRRIVQVFPEGVRILGEWTTGPGLYFLPNLTAQLCWAACIGNCYCSVVSGSTWIAQRRKKEQRWQLLRALRQCGLPYAVAHRLTSCMWQCLPAKAGTAAAFSQLPSYAALPAMT